MLRHNIANRFTISRDMIGLSYFVDFTLHGDYLEVYVKQMPGSTCIDSHSETLYTVRTPKMGHFIWTQSDSIFGRVDLQGLPQIASRFANWHVWARCWTRLAILPRSVRAPEKRHLSPCAYSCALLLTCISCVSVN